MKKLLAVFLMVMILLCTSYALQVTVIDAGIDTGRNLDGWFGVRK